APAAQPVESAPALLPGLGRIAPPACPPAPCALPPAPPACAPYEDINGPVLIGDALLERPGTPPRGWFGAVELDFFGPHLRNRLVNTVDVAGLFTDVVDVPTPDLDWAVSPRFELGYRFAEGTGAFLMSYYFLTTRGSDVVTGFDPIGDAV